MILTVALISHPFGFFRFPLNISLYKSMLLLLMASSKVMVIICGTSLAGTSPGIVVPSSEQKQSGNTQTAGSQGGALLGSDSASVKWRNQNQIKNFASVKTRFTLLNCSSWSEVQNIKLSTTVKAKCSEKELKRRKQQPSSILFIDSCLYVTDLSLNLNCFDVASRSSST